MTRQARARPSDGATRAAHDGGKILTFKKFHDEIGHALALAELVDGYDVFVLEPASRRRFVLEALQHVTVTRGVQDFDRDGAADIGIPGLKHTSEATGTDFRTYLVFANPFQHSELRR